MDYDEDYCQDTGSDWSEESEEEEVEEVIAVDRRKPYKILTEEEIAHLQENDISTVSGVLSVPRGVATALLCRNNWSLTSAYDNWFAAAAGEGNPEPPVQRDSIKRHCQICYEKTDIKEAVSATCGHPFCAGCLKSYIAAAIRDGAGCLTLDCPEPGCGAAITSDLVKRLASPANLSRYNQYLLRSYVESSRNRKWCPSPGCDRAVELDTVELESFDVVCDCSFEFCWGCTGERHSPLGCSAATEWAESARWILANTKPCPSCRRPIEKSGGLCDHIVCLAPCSFEFCWTCSMPWKSNYHLTTRCSRCEERKSCGSSLPCTKINKAKPNGNCYERWDFNEESRKKAMDELSKARRKYAGERSGEMEFMVEAWEQIVEGWRVLNWSYVYVNALPEVLSKRAVLEHFQAVAKGGLDRLQRCVEDGDKGVRFDSSEYRLFRNEATDLTKIANKYFESLVMVMKDEVESYALNWEKEALELKNDIAIAEIYAKDLEMEDLEAREAAIVECYALDLQEMEEDLDTKNRGVQEMEEDLDTKNRAEEEGKNRAEEEGTAALDYWNNFFDEFGSSALDSKDDLAEANSCVFDREKEVLGVKDDFAECECHLDSDEESNGLKNELADVESLSLDSKKEATDLKNELSEAEGEAKEGIDSKSDSSSETESYVFVSDTDEESDLDGSYAFLSDEEALLKETV